MIAARARPSNVVLEIATSDVPFFTRVELLRCNLPPVVDLTACRGTAGPGPTRRLELESLENRTLLSVLCVTDTSDSATDTGSLRYAIANTQNGDTIDFQIPTADSGYSCATGSWTIAPTSALPHVNASITIDGTSQPGYATAGHPVVVISGADAGGADGLDLTGVGITIKGLDISGFGNDGLFVTSSDNTIQGDFIGVDATGTQAAGNGNGVVIDSASNNWIGANPVYGPENTDQRNVISGNWGDGVQISGPDANENQVAGNYIGLSADGAAALPNGNFGVRVTGGATNTRVGTDPNNPNALERNVISGNGNDGVHIEGAGSGNMVAGNYIGTDATGTIGIGNGIGNGGDGVAVEQNNCVTVGGTVAGAGNTISGNVVGVLVTDGDSAGSSYVLVAGNLIGTNASGSAAIPNQTYGVWIGQASPDDIEVQNTIGGTTASARNLISGNTQGGIDLDGLAVQQSLVEGNFIGTNLGGTQAIPNTGPGVVVSGGASGNTIGGVAGSTGNLISGNTGDGVDIFGSGTTDNVVAGNLVGTDASGTSALPNTYYGVVVYAAASGNTIGGTTPGAGNVVSGNGIVGVFLTGTTGNVVAGNEIGTNLNGTAAVANAIYGVAITGGASGNLIGGSTAAARNIISGNTSYGIAIYSFPYGTPGSNANLVEGNYIGTDASGTQSLGNGGAGISIFGAATSNTIGGIAGSTGNLISGNTGDGVEIFGPVTTDNVVAGNLIGTTATGEVALGNSGYGISVSAGADDNWIGVNPVYGPENADQGNVISGNAYGVFIQNDSSGNVVAGNLIGTTATGEAALGNSAIGVVVLGADNNWIGVNPVSGPRMTTSRT